MPVPDTERNAQRCMCPGCPTYNDCMRDKGSRMFCSRGATDCNPEAKGCICGDCPVWSEYDLGTFYFCMDGAAP